MMAKTFAFDFDGVWDEIQEVRDLAIALHHAGHRVVLVSARSCTHQNLAEIRKLVPDFIQVFLTNQTSKIQRMEREGIAIDVWIDDDPVALCGGYGKTKPLPTLKRLTPRTRNNYRRFQ